VPAVAVQQGPQGPYVFVVANGAAQQRGVQVAQVAGERAVIAKGVTAGEQVVIEGQNQLRAGSPVAPVAAQRGSGS